MPIYPTAGDTVPRLDLVINPGGVTFLKFDYTEDPDLLPNEPGMLFGSRKTGTFDIPISAVGSIQTFGDQVWVTINAEDQGIVRGLDYIFIDEEDSPNNLVLTAGEVKPWTGPGTAPSDTVEVVPGAAETVIYRPLPVPGPTGPVGTAVVEHGTVAATARPDVVFVVWFGSVEPDNMISTDLWVDEA